MKKGRFLVDQILDRYKAEETPTPPAGLLLQANRTNVARTIQDPMATTRTYDDDGEHGKPTGDGRKKKQGTLPQRTEARRRTNDGTAVIAKPRLCYACAAFPSYST
jgi:hypothetical protein